MKFVTAPVWALQLRPMARVAAFTVAFRINSEGDRGEGMTDAF
jgi:hypothetical protein